MKRILPLVILLVGIAVVFLMLNLKPTPSKKSAAAPRPSIEAMPVSFSPVWLTVHSQGLVEAKQQIDLTAEVTGKVLSVSPQFVEGAMVKKGTLLLTVDPTDYQLAKEQAQSNLMQAETALYEEQARFNQAKEDQELSGSSVSQLTLRTPYLKQAQSNVAVAKAQLLKTKRDLSNTVIRAPFDGVIKDKAIDQGQLVSLGMSVAQFLGTNTVEVRLPLTQKQRDIIIPQIRQNNFLEVTLSLSSDPSTHWQGKAIRFDSSISPDTRVQFVTVEVQAPYDNTLYSKPLLIGSFVEAGFAGIKVDSAVRIPRESLHGEYYVFLVNDKQELEKRDVSVLRFERQTAVLSAGINEGDLLAVTRLGVMFSGMPVKAKTIKVDEINVTNNSLKAQK